MSKRKAFAILALLVLTVGYYVRATINHADEDSVGFSRCVVAGSCNVLCAELRQQGGTLDYSE